MSRFEQTHRPNDMRSTVACVTATKDATSSGGGAPPPTAEPYRARRRWRLVAPALAAATLLAGVLVPPSAGATTRTTIWKDADSTGPIVVDSSGNGYVAWDSSKDNANGDPVYFCKIKKGGTCTKPVELPIPAHTNWDTYRVNQPYPVIGGKAGVVSIVAPSYDLGDVVVWTSTDMGKRFGEPKVITNCQYDGTGTDDVLRSPDADTPYYPDYFVISSSNPGLFYTFTGIGAIGALDPPYGFQQDTSKVAGAVTSSTVGFGKTEDPGPSQETQTIQAFSTDADKPQLDYFWSPVPGVSGSPGSLEHGPINVAVGTNPRLASGPKGLFLLSEDFHGSPAKAKKIYLDVRKWDPTSHKFGAPTLVTTIPNDISATNEGGFSEDASNGTLTVVWPKETSGGGYDMEMWNSTNGGSSFSSATDLAPVNYAYGAAARVATVGGHGFATWQDSGGLELVDLSHV